MFAKGRSALEALAVGAAVILCDMTGVGGMVKACEFERQRRLNFGIRLLREPLSVSTLVREIERYDAADAADVSRHVRATAGRGSVIEEILALYAEAVEEYSRLSVDREAEARAEAAYLRDLPACIEQRFESLMKIYGRLKPFRERLRGIPLGERLFA